MSNIMDRLRTRVASAEPPQAAEVLKESVNQEDYDGSQLTGNYDVSVTNPTSEPVVIKQNLEAVPLTGFTLETLADELGKCLEKAMQQVCINSIDADIFGIFNQVGIVPKGFYLVEDSYINKKFFVLNNSNRSSEIFKSLSKALNSTSSELISFPYVVETKITLPLKFNEDRKEFELVSTTVKSLYLTPREITDLNYSFIKEVQFWAKDKTVEGSIDLLGLKVDREEWKAAPYRI